MSFNPEDYRIPQANVYVGGKLLKNSSYNIESIDVQLSSGEKANCCQIALLCDYDYKSSKIGGGIMQRISAGKKVKVELGYDKPKAVFIGYVSSVQLEFSENGVYMYVTCYDARRLLVGNTTWETYKNESVSQIINKMLNPLRSYTEGVTVSVSVPPDKENPLSQHDLDDYRFLCNLATLTDSSFCMVGTKLQFIKNIYKRSRMSASYSWGKSLISFSRSVDLEDQLGSITVTGNEPDTIKEFSATAKPVSGKGKTGAQLCSSVKGKEKTITSHLVKNQSEAKTYAEALMFQRSLKLCTGNATVVGDPKLMPGDKVRFDGLDPSVNGEYYMTMINHKFSAAGYLTVIGFSACTA